MGIQGLNRFVQEHENLTTKINLSSKKWNDKIAAVHEELLSIDPPDGQAACGPEGVLGAVQKIAKTEDEERFLTQVFCQQAWLQDFDKDFLKQKDCPDYRGIAIIDGHNLTHGYFPSVANKISGGLVKGRQAYFHIESRAEALIRCFRACGYSVCMVFDGAAPMSKINTRVSRQKQQNKNALKASRAIMNSVESANANLAVELGEGSHENHVIGGRSLPMPLMQRRSCQWMFHRLGVESIVPQLEADIFIACLSREHLDPSRDGGGAIVLSSDSDFLVMGTPVARVETLRIKKGKDGSDWLSMTLYDSEYLSRILDLDRSFLPVLSCLAGNDHYPKRQWNFRRLALRRAKTLGMTLPKRASAQYEEDEDEEGLGESDEEDNNRDASQENEKEKDDEGDTFYDIADYLRTFETAQDAKEEVKRRLLQNKQQRTGKGKGKGEPFAESDLVGPVQRFEEAFSLYWPDDWVQDIAPPKQCHQFGKHGKKVGKLVSKHEIPNWQQQTSRSMVPKALMEAVLNKTVVLRAILQDPDEESAWLQPVSCQIRLHAYLFAYRMREDSTHTQIRIDEILPDGSVHTIASQREYVDPVNNDGKAKTNVRFENRLRVLQAIQFPTVDRLRQTFVKRVTGLPRDLAFRFCAAFAFAETFKEQVQQALADGNPCPPIVVELLVLYQKLMHYNTTCNIYRKKKLNQGYTRKSLQMMAVYETLIYSLLMLNDAAGMPFQEPRASHYIDEKYLRHVFRYSTDLCPGCKDVALKAIEKHPPVWEDFLKSGIGFTGDLELVKVDLQKKEVPLSIFGGSS
eukprot:Clim_evm61s152 gene=Clim_evmTU61s152